MAARFEAGPQSNSAAVAANRNPENTKTRMTAPAPLTEGARLAKRSSLATKKIIGRSTKYLRDYSLKLGGVCHLDGDRADRGRVRRPAVLGRVAGVA